MFENKISWSNVIVILVTIFSVPQNWKVKLALPNLLLNLDVKQPVLLCVTNSKYVKATQKWL